MHRRRRVQPQNVAGTRAFVLVEGEGKRTLKRRAGDALSADFDERGRLWVVRDDGTVRIGGGRDATLVATIGGARWIRCAPRGDAFAVVVERHARDAPDSEVQIHRGGQSWTIAPVPPLGGVAWSPDGALAAVRTPSTIVLWEASSGSVRSLDLSGHVPSDVASGRVVFIGEEMLTPTAGGWLRVSVDGTIGVIRSGEPDDAVTACLDATRDGRLAVASVLGSPPQLLLLDLERDEVARAPFHMHLDTQSPVTLSPDGDTIAWGDYSPRLTVIPFSTRLENADRALLARLAERARGPLSDLELDELVLEIGRLTLDDESLKNQLLGFKNHFADQRKRRRRAATAGPNVANAPAPSLAVGERVSHPKFGDGTVTACDGTGDTARVTATFGAETKTLRASFLRRA